MAEEMGSRENLEERDALPDYEAPKVELLGKVEQLTSEFDSSEPPK
jgi:hypothetical protein